MTDLTTRIIEAARAAWANDYFDAVEFRPIRRGTSDTRIMPSVIPLKLWGHRG